MNLLLVLIREVENNEKFNFVNHRRLDLLELRSKAFNILSAYKYSYDSYMDIVHSAFRAQSMRVAEQEGYNPYIALSQKNILTLYNLHDTLAQVNDNLLRITNEQKVYDVLSKYDELFQFIKASYDTLDTELRKTKPDEELISKTIKKLFPKYMLLKFMLKKLNKNNINKVVDSRMNYKSKNRAK